MVKPVLREEFHHDGRGPELQRVHYCDRGATIQAIDYFNPEDVYEPVYLKHLLFTKPQVFMFTPEEVANCQKSQVDWSKVGNAAIVLLGKSEWLQSFDQMHLGRCDHYLIMFYDEFLDIICVGIQAKQGGYSKESA